MKTQMTTATSPLPMKAKDKDAYLVYVVFKLPNVSETGIMPVADIRFLLTCLDTVQQQNDIHTHDNMARSHDYFTSLNHSERYRLPAAIKRLNIIGEPSYYGVLAFQAFRHEAVKNKAFNQRVTSINTDILVAKRLKALFVPCHYPYDLKVLGHPIVHENAGFTQINLTVPESLNRYLNH